MALITCPVCGKQVSENAYSCPHCGEPMKISRMSGEVVSGTEIFHVEAGNRLQLSAKVDAEVAVRTTRLSSEGKNVINIQKSDPQAFTLGVTVWKMDVTMIWNASLDSPIFKQTIYQEAKTYQLSGQYSKAAELYGKIPEYSDASRQKADCEQKYEAQLQVAYKAAQDQAEINNAIGPDPSNGKGLYYTLWCIPMFIGFLMFIMAAQYYELNKGIFWIGLIIFGASIFACIIKAKKISHYEQEKYKYEQSKKAPPAWMTYSQSTKTINSLPNKKEDPATWKCNKCGEINSINVYFCQSCGEYKS